MDFLGDIAGALGGVFTSAASGGLFGLLGAGVGAVAQYFQRRQEQAFKKEEWAHESHLLELNMRARAAETEQELAIVSQQGAWNGLGESLKADAAAGRNAPSWVNAVRSLFRPVLTSGLLVLVYLVWRDLLAGLDAERSLLSAVLSEAEVKELLRYIVFSLVFAASTAVVWWFGDRSLVPPGHSKTR